MDQATLNHASHEKFLAYYAEYGLDARAFDRFRSIRNTILRVLIDRDGPKCKYDVLDIGCNAGTQCSVWAELGHRVHGLDINEPLLTLAKQRAAETGYDVDFRLGSATQLPWPDESMDVCIALELLEHVADWRSCLNEFARVLRPGGMLYFSTTNKLCPYQNEFNLFGYSWYPGILKRRYERLATTTRPGLANYAVYPAVHWFTPYGLREELRHRGLSSLDRFDLIDLAQKGRLAKLIVKSVRALSPLRLLAFFCTPSSTLLGIKLGCEKKTGNDNFRP